MLNNKPVQRDDLIFSDLEGQPINPNTVTPAFNKIAKRAGIELRLQDLRHTHATSPSSFYHLKGLFSLKKWYPWCDSNARHAV